MRPAPNPVRGRLNAPGPSLRFSVVNRRIGLLALLLTAGAVFSACAGSDPPTEPRPPDPFAEAVAPRLGVLAVAVALAPRGVGPFDNALPCGRRGVILYWDTVAGRSVDAFACDLGGGVVVDGRGEVRWVGPGLENARFERFCVGESCPEALDVVGDLTVSIDDVARVVDPLLVRDLALGPQGPTLPAAIDEAEHGFAGMTVRLEDTPVEVVGIAPFADVFLPELDAGAIPNPSGGAASWAEADLQRLGWDWLMGIARMMVDETVEVRDTHVHQRPCGTVRVVREDPEDLPIAEFDWDGCVDRGVVASGVFQVRWTRFDPQGGPIALELAGEIELGGAVPRTALREILWSAEFPAPLPGVASVSGEIVDATGSRRSFDFEAFLDD